jgi:tricorn protease
VLQVNDKPVTEGSRNIIVETLRNESQLRYLEWMEKNRQRVEEASKGRIGYVYMPNTSTSGLNQLVRQFYAQINKDGFIIDERFNSGGDLPDRFLTLLERPVILYLSWRNGQNDSQPLKANTGPKVMLINGWSGSGGDALPYAFKNMGIGPVIGLRTAGALIGPAMGHSLIDGGYHTVPAGRIFGADGNWFAEGHGVDPDIEVVDDPSQLAKGIDPQLERGIEEVLKMLEENPPVKVEHPPYEVR